MEIVASTATRNGVRLAIHQFASDGEPALLIHGLGAEMLFWRDEFCHGLADSGFQVARFDNRDSGQSTRLGAAGTPSTRRVRRGTQTAPYSLEDMADDVAAVLDEMKWSSSHVIGHSMGAMIAQLFAARHPDRVRSLTSISGTTSARIGRLKLATILRLLRANPADFLGRPARSPEEAAVRLIRGHRVIGSARYPPDEPWLTSIAEARFALGQDPAARVRQEAAGWASGDIGPVVKSIVAPTLVIHGEQDRFVLPEGGIATAAAIPNAEFVLLEGMGHDLPTELWPEIVRHVRRNADRASASP